MEPFYIEYKNDYDIVSLHKRIKMKFENDIQNLDLLQKEYNEIYKLYLLPNTIIKKNKLYDKLVKIQNKIDNISNQKDYIQYKDEVNDLLIQYQQKTSKIDIITNINDLFNDRMVTNDVTEIVDKYLAIASKYVEINYFKIYDDNNDYCLNCGCDLNGIQFDYDNLSCPECNCEIGNLSIPRLSNDIISSTSQNNALSNFLKIFKNYQGLENKNIDANIFKKLDDYFISKNQIINTSAHVKTLPLDKYGHRGHTNRELLQNALLHVGRNDYYENYRLIAKKYWDWKIDNLTYLEEKIIHIYTVLQQAFFNIPLEERERSSSIGTQFELYCILTMLDITCCEDDFKIPKNPESLSNMKILFRRMCYECGDNMILELYKKCNLF